MTMTATRDDARLTTSRATVQTNSFHPHRTPAIRLSVSLKRLLVQQFTPETLIEIAWIIKAEQPGMAARRRLSEASIDELAEMICAGRTPTIGWWRRAS